MKIYHGVMSNCKQNYSSLYVNFIAKYFEKDILCKNCVALLQ